MEMTDKLTKSNKIQQNNEETKLTDRQLKVIPIIVTSPTYTEGCKKAKLNRTTFYDWLKQPDFKTELDRQRDEITAEAFGGSGRGTQTPPRNRVPDARGGV